MPKRKRVTRYVAQTRLSNAGRPDTLPGQTHDTTGLSEAAIQKLIDLGALAALPDSLPADQDETNGETTP
jgi:hypothetical protein